MATLRQARCNFSYMLALLIGHIVASGYEVALDEVTERLTTKDPTSDHRHGSLHHLGLAADLNLYLHGEYLMNSEDHEQFGNWWEEMGRRYNYPLRWGGHFDDGNHYSWEWEGKQ